MLSILSGATALGLLWAIVTLGVYIAYRVLDIADLSVEGTIVTGASVASVVLANGGSPLMATGLALLAGAGAGCITGLLHTKLRIPALLSGILCMISLYSINIRLMGGVSNISLLRKRTLLTPLMDMGLDKNMAAILCGFVFVAVVVAALRWFLRTETGCAVRATGCNPSMARAQGINIDRAKMLGLILSNALVGLAGGLIAQYQGFSDIQMGTGAIVIGLASLIIGEVLFGRGGMLRTLVAMVMGAVVYRAIIALVIEAGMPATDLKLFTAITVAAALYLPTLKGAAARRLNARKEESCYVATKPHP